MNDLDELFECDRCHDERPVGECVQLRGEKWCQGCYDNYDGEPHPIFDADDFPGWSADH